METPRMVQCQWSDNLKTPRAVAPRIDVHDDFPGSLSYDQRDRHDPSCHSDEVWRVTPAPSARFDSLVNRRFTALPRHRANGRRIKVGADGLGRPTSRGTA